MSNVGRSPRFAQVEAPNAVAELARVRGTARLPNSGEFGYRLSGDLRNVLAVCLGVVAFWFADNSGTVESADAPAIAAPPAVPNPNAEAKTQADMKKYTEALAGTDVTFEMVPIPGGEFVMGSHTGEAGRGEDESPQHQLKIAPFWMGRCE